jgi:hypothetical protein
MEIGQSLQHVAAILLVFAALAYFYVRDEEHDDMLEDLTLEFEEDYIKTLSEINPLNKKEHAAIIDNFHDRWTLFIDSWVLNHKVRQMHKKSAEHTFSDLRFFHNN